MPCTVIVLPVSTRSGRRPSSDSPSKRNMPPASTPPLPPTSATGMGVPETSGWMGLHAPACATDSAARSAAFGALRLLGGLGGNGLLALRRLGGGGGHDRLGSGGSGLDLRVAALLAGL